MKRKAAAQFSFLVSAPIIAGAVAKTVIDFAVEGPPAQSIPLAVGIIVSAFWGVISIAAMMYYLQNRSMFVFVNYRIVLGIGVRILGHF